MKDGRTRTQFRPGESGNPGGRCRSIQGMVRALAKERGLDERIARMALNAILTGVLPLETFEEIAKSKVVCLERAKLAELRHPTGRLTIETVGDWIGLVRYVYPTPKDEELEPAQDTLLDFARAVRQRAEQQKVGEG